MKVVKCDRCGKETGMIDGIVITKEINCLPFTMTTNYDLCKSCIRDIEKMMHYKKKN